MTIRTSWRRVTSVATVFVFFGLAVPALAQVAPTGATATISGSVKSDAGSPVAGARVAISGPTATGATTDTNGAFSVAVIPGIYRVDVTLGGYTPALVSDVAVAAGTSTPLAITLAKPNLSSLRSIGNVSTSARGTGSSINTGAATVGYLSGQTFSESANAQINNVLQRLPDVTIQHMSSQQDTTIILGGAQPYETQVLVDGHPLALGQYGVWASQYFPSYLIGGVETQSGPGNTTPFANLAVGGTVNLLSPGFTKRTNAEFTTGVDTYQTQFSTFKTSGSLDKLSYVVSLGTSGYNGPYYQTNKCIVVPDNGGALDNKPGNSGIIQTCIDASGSFFNKGEALKTRYDFSNSTSLDLGFVGAWGGYNPQGTAWGQSVGPITITPCLAANSAQCTNPQFAGLTGSTINGYTWYTGSSLYNNQTLFDAQFRTTLGNNTILVRPYVADIQPEVILGSGQTSYPAFFSAPGQGGSAAFSAACGNAYGSTTNPAGNTVVVGGQTECFNGPYTTYEQDKLYGSTFSFLHPMGDSLINLTYDFHGQSTYAYIDNPSIVSVPLSTVRYNTVSLTGDLEFIRNVGVNVGLYDTQWKVIGLQGAVDNAGAPVVDANGNQVLNGYTRSISRFDPHFAFTFRPTGNVSYRASVGSSATFPYAGQVSGLAAYQTPAISLGPPFASGGTLTQKNPSLKPEVNIAYGLGVDKRFKNNSVLSVDLQASVIHNVFETVTTEKDLTTGGPVCTATTTQCEGIFFPFNVANLQTQLATVKYTVAPRVGFGYNASIAAERSYLQGIPPSSFLTPSLPTNNVQLCGNGFAAPGIATCVPYLKGYGQLTYRFKDGAYAGLGADYEGKNNSYFQGPFAIFDLALRKPISKNFELSLSVENLLNTNTDGQYLAEPNLGVPLVAGVQNAAGGISQTSFTPTRINAPARQARLSIRIHT